MSNLFPIRCVCAIVVFTFSFGFAHAQTLETAAAKAQEDLQSALAELTETREEIALEKIPMLQKVSELESLVRERTGELERRTRRRENRERELSRLQAEIDGIAGQHEYMSGLLNEFVNAFETGIDVSEIQLYGDLAAEARLAPDAADVSPSEVFRKQLDLVDAALSRLEQLTGGYAFEGKALMPSGEIHDGRFAVMGPTVLFASSESDVAGITYDKLNAAEAAVANPGDRFIPGIRKLLETGEGTFPADATLGKALKVAESRDTLREHLAKGGSIGYVILGLGVACALLALVKLVEVTRFKTPKREHLQAVLNHIDDEDIARARVAAHGIPGAGGSLIQTGVEHADEKRGTLEEILYERILAVRPGLERFLPFLALTAAAAPLLGLLGTVTGMIKTFSLITIFGTGDAASLSSGISEALVTTELGLVVAIPALIVHGLLSRMARRKIADLEQAAVGFINGVIRSRHKEKLAV